MAPEQALGAAESASDAFSLAKLVLELLYLLYPVGYNQKSAACLLPWRFAEMHTRFP